jgi:hypothetical protein
MGVGDGLGVEVGVTVGVGVAAGVDVGVGVGERSLSARAFGKNAKQASTSSAFMVVILMDVFIIVFPFILLLRIFRRLD